MQLSRQIWLAALTGAVTEGVLVAPIFLMILSDRFVPIMARFQYPGLAIVTWLWRTGTVQKYLASHHVRDHVGLAASAAMMLIQAAIFTLAALGVIYIVRWRISRRLLIAMFAPPLAGLMMVGALRFIYYLLYDDEAGLLVFISTVWLALAVLVAGTTLAVRRNSRAY